MSSFDETKRLLDQINATIAGYDPLLREKATEILLSSAFGNESAISSTNGNGHEKHPGPGKQSRKISLKQLIEFCSPKTESERALLSAYHLQHILGHVSITGRQIQDNLKRLGIRLTNVSMAGRANIEAVPPRLKTIDSGRSPRHRYIVTESGVTYVEQMLEKETRR